MTAHMDDLSLLKDIVSKLPLAPGEEIVVESLLSGGVVSVMLLATAESYFQSSM